MSLPTYYNSTTCDFKTEQTRVIGIARELMYGPGVIEKLKNATTSFQLSQIMTDARKQER